MPEEGHDRIVGRSEPLAEECREIFRSVGAAQRPVNDDSKILVVARQHKRKRFVGEMALQYDEIAGIFAARGGVEQERQVAEEYVGLAVQNIGDS